MPHGIRVDPDGNVWTADAASSLVRKFRPDGTLLLTIEAAAVPCSNCFCSTSDIGFIRTAGSSSPAATLSRVVEYAPMAARSAVGQPRTGPGQMQVVHRPVAGRRHLVADRENGRIHRLTSTASCSAPGPASARPSPALDGDVRLATSREMGELSAGWLVSGPRNRAAARIR
jgi:hypothetical protein